MKNKTVTNILLAKWRGKKQILSFFAATAAAFTKNDTPENNSKMTSKSIYTLLRVLLFSLCCVIILIFCSGLVFTS